MQRADRTCAEVIPEDHFGLTIAYLRALEELRLGRARQLADRYPLLKSFVDPNDAVPHAHLGLRRLRDHAVELAR